MFKPNPSVAQGGNPKLYKGTARVKFGHSKKEIHSEKPQGFSSLNEKNMEIYDYYTYILVPFCVLRFFYTSAINYNFLCCTKPLPSLIGMQRFLISLLTPT